MDRSHIYPFKIINKDNWGMNANAHKVKSGNAILNLYFFFQSYRLNTIFIDILNTQYLIRTCIDI